MRSAKRLAVLGCVGVLAVSAARADTPGVYEPYVNVREREIEYGLTWRGLGDGAAALQRLSFGYSWSDRVATELYVLSEIVSHGDATVRAQELEVILKLTEQGEYASDWGLLFELERGSDVDRNEVGAGVLWAKELGPRLVATANALVEFEYGGEIDNEIETALRAQLRYRARPQFEPAFELYLDDIDRAAGPAVQGAARLAPGRQLRWQAGLLFGFGSETPSKSLRAAIELEF
jgi:hypothetical protein